MADQTKAELARHNSRLQMQVNELRRELRALRERRGLLSRLAVGWAAFWREVANG